MVGESLYLVVPRQPQYKLKPLRGTTYEFADYDGFTVEFVMDEKDEEAEEMVLTQPGVVLRGTRK